MAEQQSGPDESAGEKRPLAISARPHFSLRRRLQLCVAMLALESFISFEEIFMVSVLQRVSVPTFLLSSPGTVSSLIGIFVLPFIGWASDRFRPCNTHCGQKRPFAIYTLIVCIVGMIILVEVNVTSLYTSSRGLNSTSTNYCFSAPEIITNASTSATALTTTASPTSTLLGFGDTSVPTLGVLAIIGFILSDHGYDLSMSTFKAYMISVTPASQHDDVFIMGTLTGGVGGCLMASLGFVDLAAIFFPADDCRIDKGIAQCLVQAVVLLVSLVLLGTCSLLTGSEEETPKVSVGYHIANSEKEIVPDRKEDVESALTYGTITDSGNQTPQVTLEFDTRADLLSGPTENIHGSFKDENEFLLHPKESKATKSRRRLKKKVFLLLMTFFGLCTNDSYFMYVTNYVAEVIFKGDPHAEAGSEAYQNYVHGEHIASLGMLTFYVLVVVFNIFHTKIINTIGMRAEYMAATVGCCVMIFTLAFTNSIVVFFLNTITIAMLRSAVYTIPYILSNNYIIEEMKEDSANGEANTSDAKSGTSMASVTAMIPTSYFIVSLLMGPLMAATGNAGVPILCASTASFLATISTFFVEF